MEEPLSKAERFQERINRVLHLTDRSLFFHEHVAVSFQQAEDVCIMADKNQRSVPTFQSINQRFDAFDVQMHSWLIYNMTCGSSSMRAIKQSLDCLPPLRNGMFVEACLELSPNDISSPRISCLAYFGSRAVRSDNALRSFVIHSQSSH